MNLLVVDDEFFIVQGIINSVDREDLGISQVYSAYSAEQARRVIENEQVDILLTDIEMPKESGLELLSWLQETHRDIITLILTGHQRFDYAHMAIKLHCLGYILKPVNKNTLNDELRNALRLRRNGLPENDLSSGDVPVRPSFEKDVRDYIISHIADPDLNRDAIAEAVHLSPDYLSYIFRKTFNETLTDYILRMRIDQACFLLKRTSLSVDEISSRVGFSNIPYFYRKFKDVTGSTPKKYRE